MASHLELLRVSRMIETDRGQRESRHKLTDRGRKLLGVLERLGAVG